MAFRKSTIEAGCGIYHTLCMLMGGGAAEVYDVSQAIYLHFSDEGHLPGKHKYKRVTKLSPVLLLQMTTLMKICFKFEDHGCKLFSHVTPEMYVIIACCS